MSNEFELKLHVTHLSIFFFNVVVQFIFIGLLQFLHS